MPMLKICTPPPDMYSINACIGSDLAGEIAKSHARLAFSCSYDVVAEEDALLGAFEDDEFVFENPGGGGRCLHFAESITTADDIWLIYGAD